LRSKESWISSMARRPGGLWNAVGNITNKKLTNRLDNLIESIGSPTIAAEKINRYFANFFCEEPDWNALKTENNGLKWEIDITVANVYDHLRKQKIRKATGSDGIPPRLLKLAAFVLASPLTHLFCLSVTTTTFPDKWKVADVVPIPKIPAPKIEDLRPISKLPVVSKILEKFILTSVKPQLIMMYGDMQFGFRPSTSTLHAHIAIQEFLTSSIDNTSVKAVLMISFDMSKAFDKLDHKALSKTMDESKLPSAFVKWCKSYLSGRKQCVTLKSFTKSTFCSVTSGVPQGAVLAPYLFAAHLGRLHPHSSDAHMIKYADDVVTLLPLRNMYDANNLLNQEIDHMMTWCKANGLELNDNKTKVMLISNKANLSTPPMSVKPTESLRILGITYDPKLKWNIETERRCKKASQRLYILRQLKKITKKSELIQVHNNFVLGILEYCGPIFLGLSMDNSQKLEKVQRRSHKIICGSHCDCGNFRTLLDRRESQALKCFIAMREEHHILHYLFPHYLPSGQRLSYPFCRTSRRASSFVPTCIRLLNSRLS